MVGSEMPKTLATSFLGMPRSTAARTLSLRSFEYGFMPEVSHPDQSPRKPLYSRNGKARVNFLRHAQSAFRQNGGYLLRRLLVTAAFISTEPRPRSRSNRTIQQRQQE